VTAWWPWQYSAPAGGEVEWVAVRGEGSKNGMVAVRGGER
jgi:hypothetical protein